jgi:hypothetical protein
MVVVSNLLFVSGGTSTLVNGTLTGTNLYLNQVDSKNSPDRTTYPVAGKFAVRKLVRMDCTLQVGIDTSIKTAGIHVITLAAELPK